MFSVIRLGVGYGSLDHRPALRAASRNHSKENSVARTLVGGRVRVEHGRKRVRAYLGGELAADTTSPLVVGRCRTTRRTTSRPATSGRT